jgi:YD repeat-containing protein
MPVEQDLIAAKGGIALGPTGALPAELEGGKLKASQVPSTVETSTLKPGEIKKRDGNGNPTEIEEGGLVTTYTWNGEGNPATETRAGHTKTFRYTNGVLTGWTVV